MLNKIANRIVNFFSPNREEIEKSDYGTVVKTGFLEIIEADIASTQELLKAVDVSLIDQENDLAYAIERNDEALNKSEDDEDLLSNKLYLQKQKDELFDKGLIVKSGLYKKLNDLQKAYYDIDSKDLDINESDEGKYLINLESSPDFKTLVKSEDEGKTFQEYLEVISEVLANPKKIYDDDAPLEPEPELKQEPEPVKLEYQKYMHHSLGRDRESMPQISKKDIDEAVIHFAQKSPNTKVKKKSISLYKLRPAQSELNDEKVMGMVERDDIDISKEIFIVSKDNYLVDSHHRWATLLEKYKDSEEEPMVTVYKINLDTAELLRRFNLLKISGKKDVEDNVKKSEELEKSLYIKREGGPGNYKYTYPSDLKGRSSAKGDQGVKDKGGLAPEEKAKNFKEWFGDSKVVDEKGEPMVVYHGVGKKGKFNEFKENLIGATSGNSGHFGTGFYFTPSKKSAENFSEMYGGTGEAMAVFLSIQNPFYPNHENLAKIGEKYNLDLPNKIAVSIDKQDFIEQVKKKDPISGKLLQYIGEKGYSEGWSKFLDESGDDVDNAKFDLNTVADWSENFEGDRYDGVSDDFLEEMEELGIKPKVNMDYEEELRMDYLTDLGQDAEGWTEAIKKEGHDGVMAGEEILVFKPNQIKSADDNEGTFDPNSNDMTKSETVTIDGKSYTGSWKTVKGNKVFISGGKMVVGPEAIKEDSSSGGEKKDLKNAESAKLSSDESKYLDYTNGKKKISRDAVGKLQAKVQQEVNKKASSLSNDNLSSEHIDALTTYVSEKYKEINSHMRGIKKTSDKGLLKTIDHINDAISKNTLKEDLIVYRSVSDKSHLESDKAFQSVSLDPSVAFNFSRSEDSQVYAVRIPAGTNYAYLGGSEKELVLNNKVDLSKQVINN